MEFLSFCDASSYKLDNLCIRKTIPNSFKLLVCFIHEFLGDDCKYRHMLEQRIHPSHLIRSPLRLEKLPRLTGKRVERGDYRLQFDPLDQVPCSF